VITCPTCKSLLDEMGHAKVRCPFCSTVIETELTMGKPRVSRHKPRRAVHEPIPGSEVESPRKGDHEDGGIGIREESDEQFVPSTYIAPMGLPATEEIIHAGLSRRFLAWLIDILIISLISFPLIYFGMGLSSLEELLDLYFDATFTVEKLQVIILSSVVHIPYFLTLETRSQQSVGKRIMEIVVVLEDISSVDGRGSLLRNIPRVIYEIPYIGFAMYVLDAFLIHSTNRRIGDSMARTFVVEKDYYDFKRQGLRLPDLDMDAYKTGPHDQ